MKKNLLKSLVIFLLLPVLIFVGCKDSKSLPSISISRYFKEKVTVSRNGFAESNTEKISILTQSKAKDEYLSPYTKFEIAAQPIWIYKMYIEKIEFYVYSNQYALYQEDMYQYTEAVSQWFQTVQSPLIPPRCLCRSFWQVLKVPTKSPVEEAFHHRRV